MVQRHGGTTKRTKFRLIGKKRRTFHAARSADSQEAEAMVAAAGRPLQPT
jgi:hypothetical protein